MNKSSEQIESSDLFELHNHLSIHEISQCIGMIYRHSIYLCDCGVFYVGVSEHDVSIYRIVQWAHDRYIQDAIRELIELYNDRHVVELWDKYCIRHIFHEYDSNYCIKLTQERLQELHKNYARRNNERKMDIA
jgi:hypothetical protein